MALGLILVLSAGEIVWQVVEGSALQRSETTEYETLSLCVHHFPVAYVTLGTTLLWAYISPVLVSHLLGVEADKLAGLSVPVVLYRSTPVIVDGVILFRHHHLHAESVERWFVLGILVHFELLLDDEATAFFKLVGHDELGIKGGQVVSGCYLIAFLLEGRPHSHYR